MNKITFLVAAALAIGGVGAYWLGNTNLRNMDFGRENISAGSPTTHHHSDFLPTNQHRDGDSVDHHMMVSSEREFITHMIPHHQEAVDTAKQVLTRGATTPEVKALMESIVSAQEKEITDMKEWYETWYGIPYESSTAYEPMMRDLTLLSGAELDKAFLEDMIRHHMGAIMMARSLNGYIEHEELRILTDTIIKTQTEEIQLMRELQARL